MLKRLLVAASLALALTVAGSLAGCGAQKGDTMLTYLRGRDVPSMMTADRSGTYAVYPSNSFNPLMRVHLSRGDQYGFTKREDKVYAVAAGQETPLGALTATSYYWKYQPGGE
jgi:hypothetical protein